MKNPKQKVTNFRKSILLLLVSLCFFSFELTFSATNDTNNLSVKESSLRMELDPQKLDYRNTGLEAFSNTSLIRGVSFGSKDATVKILVFSVYNNGLDTLNEFYSKILPQLETDYIETGKVNVVAIPVFTPKNIDIGILCADEQEYGWQLNRFIFGKDDLSVGSNIPLDLAIKEIKVLAEQLPLNQSQFDNCLSSSADIVKAAMNRRNNRVDDVAPLVINPMVLEAKPSFTPAIAIGTVSENVFVGKRFFFVRADDELINFLIQLISELAQ